MGVYNAVCALWNGKCVCRFEFACACFEERSCYGRRDETVLCVRIAEIVLQDHMETCVVEQVRPGNVEVVDEAMRLIKKFM